MTLRMKIEKRSVELHNRNASPTELPLPPLFQRGGTEWTPQVGYAPSLWKREGRGSSVVRRPIWIGPTTSLWLRGADPFFNEVTEETFVVSGTF